MHVEQMYDMCIAVYYLKQGLMGIKSYMNVIFVDFRIVYLVDAKVAFNLCKQIYLQSIGVLMRPLEPTRELPKPREKNVIDRLMESTKSRLGLQRSDSIYSTRTQAKVNEVSKGHLNIRIFYNLG